MAYCQLMPLGTMIPDRSLQSLLFAFFYSGFGGIGLAGLVWYLPRIIRGEVGSLAPGELLITHVG